MHFPRFKDNTDASAIDGAKQKLTKTHKTLQLHRIAYVMWSRNEVAPFKRESLVLLKTIEILASNRNFDRVIPT